MSGVDVGEASVPLVTKNEQLWDLLIGVQLGMRLAYPMSYVKTNECKADLTDDSTFFSRCNMCSVLCMPFVLKRVLLARLEY